MSRALSSFFVVFVLQSSPVWADSFCGQIRNLERLAQSNFDSIAGSIRSSRSWRSTLTLPGAQDCNVRVSTSGETALWCTWDVGVESYKQEYYRLATAVQACLPEAQADIDPLSDQEPSAIIRNDDVKFYMIADNDEKVVNFSVARR